MFSFYAFIFPTVKIKYYPCLFPSFLKPCLTHKQMLAEDHGVTFKSIITVKCYFSLCKVNVVFFFFQLFLL